jgi:hypothetical protein
LLKKQYSSELSKNVKTIYLTMGARPTSEILLLLTQSREEDKRPPDVPVQ